MNPRSKSEWMTPAHCGAVIPAVNVQARVSFSPVVRYVREAEEVIDRLDEVRDAGGFGPDPGKVFLRFSRSQVDHLLFDGG